MKKLLLLLLCVPLLLLFNSCKPDICYCEREWFTANEEDYKKCRDAYGDLSAEEWTERTKKCKKK
jgi:hypothetical protein